MTTNNSTTELNNFSLDLLKNKDFLKSLAHNQPFVSALRKNKSFVRTVSLMYGYDLLSPADFEILKRMGARFL